MWHDATKITFWSQFVTQCHTLMQFHLVTLCHAFCHILCYFCHTITPSITSCDYSLLVSHNVTLDNIYQTITCTNIALYSCSPGRILDPGCRPGAWIYPQMCCGLFHFPCLAYLWIFPCPMVYFYCQGWMVVILVILKLWAYTAITMPIL
jgi:hypothetical protein